MEDQNKVLDQKLENEDELFTFVEYSPEAAEMIGYSDYSYWKSVFQNFLKKKLLQDMLVQFYLFLMLKVVKLLLIN